MFCAFYRKTPSSFGWDIGPSFPSAGIWRPIALTAFNHGRIINVKFSCLRTNAWKVNVEVIIDIPNPGEVGNADSEVVVSIPGVFEASKGLQDGDGEATADGLRVVRVQADVGADAVEVWWPRGFEGKGQRLYELTAELRVGGVAESSKTVR